MKIDSPASIEISKTVNTVSLTDVSFDIDGKTILDKLNFEISAVRIGVVGRNGSGKSTLGRLMAGLISPSRGTVRINEIDVAKDRKKALREVGIIFQNPDHQIIFPTVEEEITFGLLQQGHSKQEANALAANTLAEFDKSHWSEAHVSTLSQGQKHLVCMMSVVAMKPSLIVLDEPFTGLDIPTKEQLNRYLKKYNGGLVHITHEPDDLAGYEKTIWLEQGSVAAVGDAEEILAEYTSKMRKLGGNDDISDLAN